MSSAVRLSACFSTGSARAPIPRARGRGASAVPQQVRLPTALAAAARGCCHHVALGVQRTFIETPRLAFSSDCIIRRPDGFRRRSAIATTTSSPRKGRPTAHHDVSLSRAHRARGLSD